MHPYSYDVRLLMCPNCGGALQVPPGGGHCQCSYCGMTSAWNPRGAQSQHSAAGDEQARIGNLAAQASQPDQQPPQAIRHLFPAGGVMNPAHADTAVAEFQRARTEISTVADAGERIFFLTIGLYNVWAGPEQQTRQRALMETAAELLAEASHRAALYGMMARNACRGGDLTSANQWLGRMDPYSQKLRADSAFRLTSAYLNTAEGDFGRVINVLGDNIGDIPLSAGDIAMCLVMRANAHEQQGDVAKAAAQLVAAMQHAAHFKGLIRAIIDANPTLGMCATSYDHAVAHG